MQELYSAFKISLDSLNLENIVCLDETALSNIGNTNYGYFAKGKQPEAFHVPKKERLSLLMAIHPSEGILAVSKTLKAFNKESFLVFLKEVLIPKLPLETKAILMDNISFHHSKEVLAIFESHGIQPLFIPPYSPRCNPIEEVFSQLKRIYRSLDVSKDSFSQKVEASVDCLKLYKDLSPYYKHTRSHVEATCRTLRL